MSFARWMDDFDPIIPDLDFDLTEMPTTDPMLLSATREEWAAMELAAIIASSSGSEMAAEASRAVAGYDNLNGQRRAYWPHDNDPED